MRLTATDMSIVPYVLKSAFQFCFLSWKPCLFLLEYSLEFVIHRGKNKFISFPVKFHADRSNISFVLLPPEVSL